MIQTEIPLGSRRGLLTDGKGGIEQRAVFEELLVHVLHLHDEFLALVVLAVHIEDGTSCVIALAELLGVEVRYVPDVLLAVEHGVQKTYEQLLVELRAEQPLEAKVGMWIDVSFSHVVALYDYSRKFTEFM